MCIYIYIIGLTFFIYFIFVCLYEFLCSKNNRSDIFMYIQILYIFLGIYFIEVLYIYICVCVCMYVQYVYVYKHISKMLM